MALRRDTDIEPDIGLDSGQIPSDVLVSFRGKIRPKPSDLARRPFWWRTSPPSSLPKPMHERRKPRDLLK
jgi:hypothetical protein